MNIVFISKMKIFITVVSIFCYNYSKLVLDLKLIYIVLKIVQV